MPSLPARRLSGGGGYLCPENQSTDSLVLKVTLFFQSEFGLPW